MTISIDFPAITDVPAELPLLAVLAPKWSRDAVAELGRQFHLDGEQIDAGTWTIVRDPRAALEIYHNSNSFRFERLDIDGEGRKAAADSFAKDKAIDVANGFAEAHAPRGARLGEPDVAEQELLVSEREGAEPTRILTALQVNYRYSHEGFDLMGPGAKTQVTIGADAEIMGAYRFWRDVRVGGSVKTVSPDEANERFAASELFAELEDNTATCRVTNVRFGYLTRPPTEAQGTLMPAYEFRGVLSTEFLPRYEFTSYVIGCHLDEGDAKWASRVGSLSERLTR
jgi:hypothetical protein